MFTYSQHLNTKQKHNVYIFSTATQNKKIMFTYSQHLNTKQKHNVYIFSTSKHKTKT